VPSETQDAEDNKFLATYPMTTTYVSRGVQNRTKE
jgi:hypothetical protein